jgi:hypothetical protein
MIIANMTLWADDDQQFHQYLQSEQSLLALTELTEHRKISQHVMLEIQALA